MKKMIVCKTCGAEISSKAKVCSHCGEPTVTKQIGDAISGLVGFIVALPFIVIAIIFFLLLAY